MTKRKLDAEVKPEARTPKAVNHARCRIPQEANAVSPGRAAVVPVASAAALAAAVADEDLEAEAGVARAEAVVDRDPPGVEGAGVDVATAEGEGETEDTGACRRQVILKAEVIRIFGCVWARRPHAQP